LEEIRDKTLNANALGDKIKTILDEKYVNLTEYRSEVFDVLILTYNETSVRNNDTD
jgi:hypothetical protein